MEKLFKQHQGVEFLGGGADEVQCYGRFVLERSAEDGFETSEDGDYHGEFVGCVTEGGGHVFDFVLGVFVVEDGQEGGCEEVVDSLLRGHDGVVVFPALAGGQGEVCLSWIEGKERYVRLARLEVVLDCEALGISDGAVREAGLEVGCGGAGGTVVS